MAIAFDAQSRNGGNGAGNRTVSHTCASGAVLFAGALAEDGDFCTGITYNGTAMTFLAKQSSVSTQYIYLYFLGTPSSGANDLVASFSSGSNFKSVLGVSYTGASTTTPTNFTSSEEADSSLTLSLTVSDDWTVMMGNIVGAALSAGTGSTLRTASAQNDGMLDSNGAQTGSYSMTISGSGAFHNAGIMAEISTAGASSSIKTVDGLAIASVKTVNGLAIANVKNIMGLA